MRLAHFTARLRESIHGRLDGEHGSWLWTHLRQAFPDTLAATLMPNHTHLFTNVADLRRAYVTFTKVHAAFARGFPGPRPIWGPIRPPKLVVGANKVLHEVRYIALNAARKKLVDDPLEWHWSTYRDLFGATADPWVTFDRVRTFLPSYVGGDVLRLHAFVSSDRSTRVGGTPPPVLVVDELEGRGIAELLAAAAAATRSSTVDHRRQGAMRRVFVWLAASHGWDDRARLAEICGVTPRAIAKILTGPAPLGLDAARRCLADARLRALLPLSAVRPRKDVVEATAAYRGSIRVHGI